MITIRQALQKIGLLSSEAEESTLYNRLNVLLRDTSVGMKSIVAESVRFVRTAKENSRGGTSTTPMPCRVMSCRHMSLANSAVLRSQRYNILSAMKSLPCLIPSLPFISSCDVSTRN
jgi:hypothetical protein